MTTLAPQKFKWQDKERKALMGMVVIGVLTFLVGLKVDSHRLWAAYLHQYFFWLCIALAGVFFVALHFLTGAIWSGTIRRVAGCFGGFLPVAVVLFIILLFGLHSLYEWTHPHVVLNNLLLSAKRAYLNVPFFIVRSAVVFGVCFILGGLIFKNSVIQDESGDPQLTKMNVKLSAAFILIFAWSFSFMSFDLMMSLSPHWFSTIFGVYCFAGLFYSGLAMLALAVIFLKKRGILLGFVTADHLHDVGKLMFAFTVFWAYIAFSQFMLIWYANLPEETFYFIRRLEGSWKSISIALILVKFVFPFFMLVSRFAKRSEHWLFFTALWFLVAQWLDVYWLVYPNFFDNPVFGWQEVGLFVGFAGLFLLSVGERLRCVLPVPIKDPLIEETLHHHQ